jgi:hypothetical protein
MDAARGESRNALTGEMNASQQTTAWFAAAPRLEEDGLWTDDVRRG